MDFPRTVDEITPEWLTLALRESGAINTEFIQDFDATSVGGDRGVSGLIYRIEPKYSRGGGGPTSVIAKFASDQKAMREWVKGAYGIELRVFRDLDDQIGIRIPRSYFGTIEPDSGYFCLLMEDLGRLREVELDVDPNQVDAVHVVESAARMHSRWWNNPDLPMWLHGVHSLPSNAVERLVGNIDKFLEIGDGVIPRGFEAIAREYAPKWFEIINTLCSKNVTLTHGDFKLLNMFFDDEANESERLVLYDWQVAGRMPGTPDIAEFIMSSYSVEGRRIIEKSLMERYHSTLVDHGVKNYSFDQFTDSLRLALLARASLRINSIALGGESLLNTEIGRRNLFSRLERLQMLIDWNCDEVIPK
jgi:hypothetical protein